MKRKTNYKFMPFENVEQGINFLGDVEGELQECIKIKGLLVARVEHVRVNALCLEGEHKGKLLKTDALETVQILRG